MLWIHLCTEFEMCLSLHRPILMEKPDVVVGTPSRVRAHVKAQNLLLDALEMFVVDEADLLFSFGFEADLKDLIWWVFYIFSFIFCSVHNGSCENVFKHDFGFLHSHLPKIYQAFLMSATLNDDVQVLKELVLHNPVSMRGHRFIREWNIYHVSLKLHP